MKRFLIGFISMIGAAAVLAIAAVAALNAYYCHKDVFPMRVWINGTYCTGMTVDEVASMLRDSYGQNEAASDIIRVRTVDGELHELLLCEYGVDVVYDNMVRS